MKYTYAQLVYRYLELGMCRVCGDRTHLAYFTCCRICKNDRIYGND